VAYIFQRKPVPPRPDYTSSHVHKGSDYHERFDGWPPCVQTWALEREIVRQAMAMVDPSRVLDLACGTGRVTRHVVDVDPTVEVHGVDVSASMLDIAREACPSATFHLLDVRDAADALGHATFDMAVAFRFFANAERALRHEASVALYRLIRPGGLLVLNNHRGFWSVPYVAKRLGSRGPHRGATNREIRRLFPAPRFRTIRRFSLAVVPQTESRYVLVPTPLARRIESANFRHVSRLHLLGADTVWVLQRGP
jgi:ubiquinone/menaquinone biosynthesis C-methylase UbiE